jgi:hypothetical protein
MKSVRILVFLMVAMCRTASSADDSALTAKHGINPKFTGTHTIYGRVLDQEGNPVVGADVEIGWKTFTADLAADVLTGHAQTDENGNWEFMATGFQILVRWPAKTGYDLNVKNPYLESQDHDLEGKTSKENPVVLYMRKKGATTFVLQKHGIMAFSLNAPTNAQFCVDILQGRVWPVGGPLPKRMENCVTDMLISVDGLMMPSNETWRVSFRAADPSFTMIPTNERVYVTPESGYGKEVASDSRELPKTLCFKGRSTGFYGRLELDPHYGRGVFWMYCDIAINPYGERNLEEERELDGCWRVRDRLEKEAKEALRAGRLAPKPDLPALIVEEKAKAEKK